jgi:hypothetical protein
MVPLFFNCANDPTPLGALTEITLSHSSFKVSKVQSDYPSTYDYLLSQWIDISMQWVKTITFYNENIVLTEISPTYNQYMTSIPYQGSEIKDLYIDLGRGEIIFLIDSEFEFTSMKIVYYLL